MNYLHDKIIASIFCLKKYMDHQMPYFLNHAGYIMYSQFRLYWRRYVS